MPKETIETLVSELVHEEDWRRMRATAACVAEHLQGHGQSISSFLYIYAGTFIGGALVLAGHIMGGERGNAGAIGSLPVALGSAMCAASAS